MLNLKIKYGLVKQNVEGNILKFRLNDSIAIKTHFCILYENNRMHNLIQELRGNVRVFARVRPFLPGDGVDDDAVSCVVPKSETSLKLVRNCVLGKIKPILPCYQCLICLFLIIL